MVLRTTERGRWSRRNRRIAEMVRELAAGAGIPTPKLYLIEANYANAFATGRNPAHGAVAVTTGLLRVLSRREVRGVVAHENAHIRNRDVTIATVAAASPPVISGIANAVQFSAFFGGSKRRRGRRHQPAGDCCSRSSRQSPRPGADGHLRSREYSPTRPPPGSPETRRPWPPHWTMAFAADVCPRGSSGHREPLHRQPTDRRRPRGAVSTHPPMEERIARLRALPSGERRVA